MFYTFLTQAVRMCVCYLTPPPLHYALLIHSTVSFISHVAGLIPIIVVLFPPSVPVGVPLAPPSLSQTSSLGTQHTQPALTDTQLHSQASLLAERRDANTSCSFPSEVQPVKEEREEDMFRAPPPPAPPSVPPQGRAVLVFHLINNRHEQSVLCHTGTLLHTYIAH